MASLWFSTCCPDESIRESEVLSLVAFQGAGGAGTGAGMSAVMTKEEEEGAALPVALGGACADKQREAGVDDAASPATVSTAIATDWEASPVSGGAGTSSPDSMSTEREPRRSNRAPPEAAFFGEGDGATSLGACSPTASPCHERRQSFALSRGSSSDSKASLCAGCGRGMMRMVTRALTRLHLLHHDEALPSAARAPSTAELLAGLPTPVVPAKGAIAERHVPGLTIEQLRCDIEAPEEGFFRSFLVDAKCGDLRCTEWGSFSPAAGVQARRAYMCYTMPAPSAMPKMAKKVLKLPTLIKGTNLAWYTCSEAGDRLVLMQRVSSEGALYSGRFYVENICEFTGDAEGGVTMRLWGDTVWRQALPWTHGFLTNMIETKVSAESETTASKVEAHLRGLVDMR